MNGIKSALDSPLIHFQKTEYKNRKQEIEFRYQMSLEKSDKHLISYIMNSNPKSLGL